MPSDSEERMLIVRRLVMATITDTKFLTGLRHIWRADLAGTDWAWIAHECFNHLDKYGVAPGRNIETIWAASALNKELKSDLKGVLAGLSEDYKYEEASDSDYLLQQALDYFTREALLTDMILVEEAAESGDLTLAVDLFNKIKIPALAVCEVQDYSDNPDRIREALQRQPKSLVRLGGQFQELVGSQITRDSLVAFLGPEKVGKTWLLQTIGFGGVKAGEGVAFFQCGDLSESQQIIRLATQITGLPHKDKYCGKQLSPVLDCKKKQAGDCPEGKMETGCLGGDGNMLDYYDASDYTPCDDQTCRHFRPASWWEEVQPCKQLTWDKAVRSWKKWSKGAKGKMLVGCYPNRSVNVKDIDGVLTRLKDQSGWSPSIVICDYPDIMAPESKGEFRHQENTRWEALRRLSQDWNCAVVVATQATRDSYSKEWLKLKHTSEEKRKHAHLTSYFGINKTDRDKAKGWLRVNALLLREDDFSDTDKIVVLQHIQRGRPNIASFWFSRRKNDD